MSPGSGVLPNPDAVNFSDEVLFACEEEFAILATFTPVSGTGSFMGRGIWTAQTIDVILDNGAKLSSATLSLGIKLDEFSTWPVVGDQVTIVWSMVPGHVNASPGTSVYKIDQFQPDGQGGAKLILMASQPINAQ